MGFEPPVRRPGNRAIVVLFLIMAVITTALAWGGESIQQLLHRFR